MRVVVVVVVVSAGDAHPRQRRACVRACAGPSDASGALSRVEGEMTAFQIRSALIRADWGFDRHEMDAESAEDARTSLQMDLGDPGSYTLLQLDFKSNTGTRKSAAAGARLVEAGSIPPSRRCWSPLTADGVGGFLQGPQTPNSMGTSPSGVAELLRSFSFPLWSKHTCRQASRRTDGDRTPNVNH